MMKGESFFEFEDFKNVVFDWKDLNGKTLEVIVTKSEGITLVCGKNVENDKLYLLHEEWSSAIAKQNIYYEKDSGSPSFIQGVSYRFQEYADHVEVWDHKERQRRFYLNEFEYNFKVKIQ